MSPKITQIFLIDSQSTVRAGLRLLLQQQLAFQVMAEAADLSAADTISDQQAFIAVLNLQLPEQIEWLPQLTELAQRAPVIVLVNHQDLENHYRALGEAIQAGIKGIVFREDPEDTLSKAVEKVAAGGVWLDASTLARVLGKIVIVSNTQKNDPDIARLNQLTSREREIVTLVGEGLKNKQIASRLSLSEATIRHYLTTIFDKLEVTDRVVLAIFAHRCGLVQLPVKSDQA